MDMNSHTKSEERPTASPAIVKVLVRRMCSMALLWIAFGIVIGVLMAWPSRALIAYFSFIIAGIIVLTPVGFLLGLFAARRTDVLAAASLGLALGALFAAINGNHPVPYCMSVGLIMGGIFGATFIGVVYRLPRLIVARLESATRVRKITAP